MLTTYLGYSALAMSLVIILCGYPVQIVKNYRRKSCEGLSLLLMATVFLAYSVWSAYACVKPDWFLVWSQIPGAFLTLIILIQFAVYRNQPAKNE